MAPTIVFDLDGTLVDTAPDLHTALNHCLMREKLQTVKLEDVRRFVGQGARVMLQRAFESQDAGEKLTDAKLDELMALFIDHYRDGMPGDSTPFSGVLDALDRFDRAGWTLAVCTNKYEELARKLLSGLRIDDRFRVITGADTFDFRKPDPRHLTETIRLAGGRSEAAILIGDSRTDIATAQAADIPVVAVDFGYTDVPVDALNPDRVISHFDELTVSLAEELIG